VREQLLVTGRGFAGAVRASLIPAAPDGTTVDVAIAAATGDALRLAPQATLAAGIYTLEIVAAGGVARAELQLLAGERGRSAVVEARASGLCPDGGAALAIALDGNDNGAIDASETAVVTDLCHLSPFSCDAEGCASAAAVAAPALTVAGLPALTRIAEARTIQVPSDAPTVTAALASLAGVRLDAAIDVVVADGAHLEPTELRITHPDAARIRIRGAAAASTLRFSGTNGIVVDGVVLGGLEALSIEGDDMEDTVGVLVDNGGAAALDAVSVRAFAVGIRLAGEAHLHARASASTDNAIGIEVLEGSLLDAPAAVVTGGVSGIRVRQATAIVVGCQVGDVVTGVSAEAGVGVFDACALDSSAAGAEALSLGLLLLRDATLTSSGTDILADANSVVDATGATFTTRDCVGASVCLP
jgi:hypothetical protein